MTGSGVGLRHFLTVKDDLTLQIFLNSVRTALEQCMDRFYRFR